MKLTVLVDNHTLIDRYLYGEPGVSYFLECNGRHYLFDTGYSGLFLQNAVKLGIDLLTVDDVVLSHGHNDHTWGLAELVKFYSEAAVERQDDKSRRLIAHPGTFCERRVGCSQIGAMLAERQLEQTFDLQQTKQPLWLDDQLVFLGEIEQSNCFEAQAPVGVVLKDGVWQDDFVEDDSALVYRSPQGLVIITGCSHAGICNIIAYAKRVCGQDRIHAVIGGFHLLKASKQHLEQTAAYLAQCQPAIVYACHCTDLAAKIHLSQQVALGEAGVGLSLVYE